MPVGVYEIGETLQELAEDEKGACLTERGDAVIYVKHATVEPPPFVLANEYISAELAKLIRLPIPPTFIGRIKHSEERVFCSLNITIDGGKLPKINAALAVQEEPDTCTGVLLYDIWVCNTDRHRKNISYLRTRMPHRIGIFDHSHCLTFYPDFADYFPGELGIVGVEGGGRGNRHCLLDFLNTASYLDKWCEHIGNVSGVHIRTILEEAGELGLRPDVQLQTYDLLARRRDEIAQLVRGNRHQFTAMQDWGLLWAA